MAAPIARLAYLMNVDVERSRMEAITRHLADSGWTLPQVKEAARRIANDPEIGKEVVYAGTLTPLVFAKARKALGWSKPKPRQLTGDQLAGMAWQERCAEIETERAEQKRLKQSTLNRIEDESTER